MEQNTTIRMYFYVTVNGKQLTCWLKILEDNLTSLCVERLDVVKCKEIEA
nr:hypothetical protein [Hallella colorans]